LKNPFASVFNQVPRAPHAKGKVHREFAQGSEERGFGAGDREVIEQLFEFGDRPPQAILPTSVEL
jgi:hypothetical protein